MKIDDADTTSKSKNMTSINDEDDVESDHEQRPNTSELDESGSAAAEQVSVNSKSNRKRKHNET